MVKVFLASKSSWLSVCTDYHSTALVSDGPQLGLGWIQVSNSVIPRYHWAAEWPSAPSSPVCLYKAFLQRFLYINMAYRPQSAHPAHVQLLTLRCIVPHLLPASSFQLVHALVVGKWPSVPIRAIFRYHCERPAVRRVKRGATLVSRVY